jgi:hypothetical protein
MKKVLKILKKLISFTKNISSAYMISMGTADFFCSHLNGTREELY